MSEWLGHSALSSYVQSSIQSNGGFFLADIRPATKAHPAHLNFSSEISHQTTLVAPHAKFVPIKFPVQISSHKPPQVYPQFSGQHNNAKFCPLKLI